MFGKTLIYFPLLFSIYSTEDANELPYFVSMTPSLKLPADMSDEELIEAVAVEVMEWKQNTERWPDYSGEMSDVWKDDAGQQYVIKHKWNPLTDWNHTMEVVQKMENNGWQFWMTTFHSDTGHMYLTKVVFGKDEQESNIENLDKQRAICLAALTAVRS